MVPVDFFDRNPRMGIVARNRWIRGVYWAWMEGGEGGSIIGNAKSILRYTLTHTFIFLLLMTKISVHVDPQIAILLFEAGQHDHRQTL